MARAAAAAAALALLAAAAAGTLLRQVADAPSSEGFDTRLLTGTMQLLQFVPDTSESASFPSACPDALQLRRPAKQVGDTLVFLASALGGDCTASEDIELTDNTQDFTNGPFTMVTGLGGVELDCDDTLFTLAGVQYQAIEDGNKAMQMRLLRNNFECDYVDPDGASLPAAVQPTAVAANPLVSPSPTNTEISVTTAPETADSDATDTDTTPAASTEEKSGGLATAAKIGIGAGAGALGLLALCLLCCCCLLRRRKKAAGAKSADRHSFSSGTDVERTAPPPSAAAAAALPVAGVAAGAGAVAAARSAGARAVENTAAAVPTVEETRVTQTVRSPLPVAYDPAVEPVTDADALRDGGARPGVGIDEDGALPLHVSVALDTSELGCSAEHDDGDVRGVYARALAAMLAGMGDDVSMSLVSFSGDEAVVVDAGGRIRSDVAVAAEAVATATPPARARTSRATPKAAMRAVNACIGLLRETPPNKNLAKRVLVVSGGGVEDGEMRQLRAQANGGRGWKTANCVVTIAVGALAKMPAAVQLGAVALDVADIGELAKPEVIGLVKALFAADDPRTVK